MSRPASSWAYLVTDAVADMQNQSCARGPLRQPEILEFRDSKLPHHGNVHYTLPQALTFSVVSKMPGRQYTAPKPTSESKKRKRTKPRALNALAIAEKQNPQKVKSQSHRLGESEGRRKRRRETDEEPEDQNPTQPEKRQKAKAADSGLSSDGGSDSEGNEWRLGHVDEDDDSDLDSDDALGASDEDKFDGFVFRGSSTTQSARQKPALARKQDIKARTDLQEDEDDTLPDQYEDIEDDFGDEGVDLATALDMNAENEEEETAKAQKRIKAKTAGSETWHEDENEDTDDPVDGEDSDEERSELSLSDAEDSSEGFTKLQSFVKTMNTGTIDATTQPIRAVSTQEYEKPSDYGLKPSKKLTVEDLMPSITDSRLRSSIKLMNSADTADLSNRVGGIPGKLAPPLPKRQQDRAERSAAYEKSKEALGRWIDTVKENRRAEHVSFPLPDPDVQSRLGTKQFVPTSSSKPVNELESTIRTILQESGMASDDVKDPDAQIQAYEGLEARKLPLEEVRARQAELRKARDLLFREEIRARRINKIKSKSYRRVHRKERDKAAKEERQALAAAGVDLSEDDKEQNDRRRAEERMGGRHRESRWARGVKGIGRAAWDEDARSGVVDLARRDDELRRRIQGQRISTDQDGFDDHTSTDSDDDESIAADADYDSNTQYLQHKLSEIADQGRIDEDDESHSALHSMKFMKVAEASRKARNDAEIQRMLRNPSNVEEDDPRDPSPAFGRRKFGVDIQGKPSKSMRNANERDALDEHLSEEDDFDKGDESDPEVTIVTEKPKDKAGIQPNASRKDLVQHNKSPSSVTTGVHSSDGVNPWLAPPASLSREATLPLETEKSENLWLSAKTSTPEKHEKTSDGVELGNSHAYKHPKAQRGKARAQIDGTAQILPNGEDSSDLESGPDVSTKGPDPRRPVTNKLALVRKAFAGDDDVLEDFDREKNETVVEEGDKVVDNTLPGWGSWTGAGISKKEQKRNQGRFVTKVEGVQQDKRKDAKLERVIINEKRVKKVCCPPHGTWCGSN